MEIQNNMENVIRVLKEECGKSLSEFSEYLDVSCSALWEYMYGKIGPSAAAIELIAGKLGLDTPFLASGTFSHDQIGILLRLLKVLKLLATLPPKHRVRFAQLILEMVKIWNETANMPQPSPGTSLTEAISFRSPMRVSAVRTYQTSLGSISFPVCPHCQITMEREYQSFCDRCGQSLYWNHFNKAVMLAAEKDSSKRQKRRKP